MINEKLNKDILDLINENKTEINGMKAKLLWTNPNPTSSFSGQDISLKSNEYDIIDFYFYKSIDVENSVHCTRLLKGHGGQIVVSGTGTFGSLKNAVISRNIIYVDDKKYQISNAHYRYDTSSDYAVSNILIPIYVVGYKTGLFS